MSANVKRAISQCTDGDAATCYDVPSDSLIWYAGCIGPLQFEKEDTIPWCAARFPSWRAALSCAAAFKGARFAPCIQYSLLLPDGSPSC